MTHFESHNSKIQSQDAIVTERANVSRTSVSVGCPAGSVLPRHRVFTVISVLLKRVYFNNMVSELQRQLLTVGPRWGPGPCLWGRPALSHAAQLMLHRAALGPLQHVILSCPALASHTATRRSDPQGKDSADLGQPSKLGLLPEECSGGNCFLLLQR